MQDIQKRINNYLLVLKLLSGKFLRVLEFCLLVSEIRECLLQTFHQCLQVENAVVAFMKAGKIKSHQKKKKKSPSVMIISLLSPLRVEFISNYEKKKSLKVNY